MAAVGALQRLSMDADVVFEGLSVAARRRTGIPNHLKRKLIRLDIAYHFARHISMPKVTELLAQVDAAIALGKAGREKSAWIDGDSTGSSVDEQGVLSTNDGALNFFIGEPTAEVATQTETTLQNTGNGDFSDHDHTDDWNQSPGSDHNCGEDKDEDEEDEDDGATDESNRNDSTAESNRNYSKKKEGEGDDEDKNESEDNSGEGSSNNDGEDYSENEDSDGEDKNQSDDDNQSENGLNAGRGHSASGGRATDESSSRDIGFHLGDQVRILSEPGDVWHNLEGIVSGFDSDGDPMIALSSGTFTFLRRDVSLLGGPTGTS